MINPTPADHGLGDKARLKRIEKELEAGFDFIQQFANDRVVTVFGSARTKEGDPQYEAAVQFGKLAAEQGMTIVTGGGPGIMEAANRGAMEAGGKSAGLCIQLPDNTEAKNEYVQDSKSFYYFFVRKLMLAHVAQAYVYFPGGYGTLDEFFEISTLIATKKLHECIPVVLVEYEYWLPLKDWMDNMLTEKFKTLSDEELKIWELVDTPEDAMKAINDIKECAPRDESI